MKTRSSLVLFWIAFVTLFDFFFFFTSSTYPLQNLYVILAYLSINKLIFAGYVMIFVGLLWGLSRVIPVLKSLVTSTVLLTVGLWIYSVCHFVPFLKNQPLYRYHLLDWPVLLSLGGTVLVLLGLNALFVILSNRANWSGWFQWGTAVLVILLITAPLLLWSNFLLGTTDRTIQVETALGKQPNVLFLMVDTLPAGHLSTYGYSRRETSPNLSEFSDEALFFNRAFSTSPWTLPAVTTMFSGLYPPVHGTDSYNDKLPASIVTLPEIMRNADYQTAGISTNILVSRYFGLDRGFDYFKEYNRNRSLDSGQFNRLVSKFNVGWLLYNFKAPASDLDAETVNRRAREWLESDWKRDRPFFLYLHYMDPHTPYNPPEDLFGTKELMPKEEFTAYWKKHLSKGWDDHKIYPFYQHEPPPDHVFEEVVYRYDAEIRYWDQQLGQFLDYLKGQPYFDNTMVVLVADHGEEFYQHKHWEHGQSLFNEIIHVPMVIRLPEDNGTQLKMKNGEQVDRPVSIVDLRKTVLNLTGIDVPGDRDQEGYFEALMAGEEQGADSTVRAVSTGLGRNSFHSIMDFPWKILRISNGRQTAWELYNLNDDFGEQDQLSENHEQFSIMKSRLNEWREKLDEQKAEGARRKFDPTVQRELEGLGYVE